MLDQLTGGRLEYGVGRGAVPIEHYWFMEPAIQIGSGTPGQIIERVGALLEDGTADYICFMFPTGDMTFEESRRTLELLITEVIPHLEPSPARS